ncbi:MAG: hypothetical protein ACRDSM_02115 [Pseudonocardiaceae bacterium]
MTVPVLGGSGPGGVSPPGVGGGPVVQVFPVAIGHFTDPGLADLEVDAQVGRLVDLLAPFGGCEHRWAAPARERGRTRCSSGCGSGPSPRPVLAGVRWWVRCYGMDRSSRK